MTGPSTEYQLRKLPQKESARAIRHVRSRGPGIGPEAEARARASAEEITEAEADASGLTQVKSTNERMPLANEGEARPT